MNFLLRLKSWQLFFLIILPSLLVQIDFLTKNLVCLTLISIFPGTVQVGWIYAIGVSMHTLLPQNLKPAILYFKISCLVILLGIIFADFYSTFFINHNIYELFLSHLWIFIPISLYLFWSYLYIFMFTARMVESAIEGKLVKRSDSLKVFWWFWFFPIGIWYIQPSVQRVLNDYAIENSPSQSNKRIL